ncbi:MAG TPA: NUDIX domain-containing protein, partial [Paenisporosarcina sp.]|nr:NUDIX domain-containing protein [Paenisporosarcina sp.]
MIKPPRIVLTEENVRILPEDGFLRIKRSDVTFYYPNGEKSVASTVDRVIRQTDDAVVIVAWYMGYNGPHIYLRSSIRPALALKDYGPSGILEGEDVGNLWELPAGCLEPKESIFEAASRETKEEIGFSIPPEKFNPLGNRTFPGVGM